MARITVEDCIDKVENQYDLVLVAKERTCQLNAGNAPLVPEDNDKTRVRGGQPSRQVIRNKDYLNKCGFNYNGKYWERN